jgi:hypothetical protein
VYGITGIRSEAERLAATGVTERSWALGLGRSEPIAAWLSCDPVDDDGVSVMVGFSGPGEPSTVGVYIDHNLGGIAKDAFVVPAAIDAVLAMLQEADESDRELQYREIPLSEAAARWRAAITMTDMYLDPPTSEDLDDLRALVFARLAKLPSDGEAPGQVGLDEEERERLIHEFLESDETVGLQGSDGDQDRQHALDHLAYQIATFSLDYVLGTALRFSPVMVEVFCLDWAPRKIALDNDEFTLLPDVLAAWIRFTGHRRGIPDDAISSAVDAAYEYASEMIELSKDPRNWGPGKTMALGIARQGIDPTDQAALDEFVAQVNRDGGIDALADDLAGLRATGQPRLRVVDV